MPIIYTKKMQKVISRKSAQKLGLKEYFTGKPCPKGHIALRKVNARTCLICSRETSLRNNRIYAKRNPEKILLQAAKDRARRNGREFTLKLEDIQIPLLCPVFETRMESPSIDRIDNSKGYTKDNIRVISNRANTLKRDGTLEEMVAIVRYMKLNLGI